MINWLKLAKFYKIPIFWWQYVTTQSFQDLSSLDDVIEFGRRHRVIGFNGQCIRAFILWRLHQHFECSSFVETGSFLGYTSGYVSRAFNTPVFTCEINPFYYLISRLHLLIRPNRIVVSRSSSPDFLRTICRSSVGGSNPMFYLDAHQYSPIFNSMHAGTTYMPLADELVTIWERCEKGVVVIDDFFIPFENEFGYDQSQSVRIDLDLVNSTLEGRREDFVVYLPAYHPNKELKGSSTGFAIILIGQDKAFTIRTFPFNLLTRALS